MLAEGMPHRSIERTSGDSISTVKSRLVDAGNARAKYHNKAILNVEVSRRRPGIVPSLSDPWRKLQKRLHRVKKIMNHWPDPFGSRLILGVAS